MADPRYQPKHSASKRSNLSGRDSSFYHDDEEPDEEEERPAKYDYELDEDDEDQEQEEVKNDRYSYRRRTIEEQQRQDDDDDEEDDDDDDEDEELGRHPKKRKLKNLMDYELAPRVNSQAEGSNVRNSSYPNEWSERETFALLEAWGNRYLELGRKSLRSEDWIEVAEKVSEVSKAERLDTQCRNRLDTLKKKYKKEKAKLNEIGGGGGRIRWAYFKKMDMLMAVSPKQECGLACGVDSGEYVFMNPKVYLNCANGLDEMRDSPGNSESFEGKEEDDNDDDDDERCSSVKMLADSIQKFSTIYEKIENSKRQQMMELEKMRLDFHRELELQNKQILESVQSEIEKIQEGGDDGDDDNDDADEDSDDASAENLSV